MRQTEFASQRIGDLIDIRAWPSSPRGTTSIIENVAIDPSNDAFALSAIERGIDG
jgi:hypothetical protein